MIQLRNLRQRPIQGLGRFSAPALLRDTLSGLVFALVIVTYCISFSALIFQGDLKGGLTLGLSALLTGTVITQRRTSPPMAVSATLRASSTMYEHS